MKKISYLSIPLATAIMILLAGHIYNEYLYYLVGILTGIGISAIGYGMEELKKL